MSSKRALTYNQIKDLILYKIMPLRIKALIATQYGTGARIGEILPYKNNKGIMFPGLQKADIENKEGYYLFRLPNFKNAKKKFKEVGIPKEKEAWLLQPILMWINQCSKETLFSFHERRARELIKVNAGFSSHYLRHSRATHLAQIFNYNAYEIQQTLGHSKLDTSQIYVDSRLEDRMKKMEFK